MRLSTSDFQLPPQNPVKQSEQTQGRSNQHQGIEHEYADPCAEITLFRAKENVRPGSAAIIALLHLRVRNQIRNLLVHIDLLGGDRTFRLLEVFRIECFLS